MEGFAPLAQHMTQLMLHYTCKAVYGPAVAHMNRAAAEMKKKARGMLFEPQFEHVQSILIKALQLFYHVHTWFLRLINLQPPQRQNNERVVSVKTCRKPNRSLGFAAQRELTECSTILLHTDACT